MADISQEIDDFKSAIYGEEVRDSMVSLAQKLNTEVEANTTNVNQAVSTANSASSAANQAVQDANTTLQAANQAVQNAAGSASAAAGSASAASGSASAAAQSAANAAEVAEGLGGFNGKASSVKAEDTQDLLGSAGEETNVQALIDYIADQVKNQLVSDSALTDKLANYILKNQIINNLLATQAGNVLDATQGKALSDMIGDTSQLPEGAENLVGAVTQLNSDFDAVGTTLISHPSSQFDTTIGQTYTLCELSLPAGKWLVIGACLATGNMYIGNADFGGTTRSYRANNLPEHTGIALAFSSGNKTVNLSLRADYIVSTVHSDPSYCYLRAIRIG